jgi:hypothetical protein
MAIWPPWRHSRDDKRAREYLIWGMHKMPEIDILRTAWWGREVRARTKRELRASTSLIRANPSRGGDAKPKGLSLQREAAGLPKGVPQMYCMVAASAEVLLGVGRTPPGTASARGAYHQPEAMSQ